MSNATMILTPRDRPSGRSAWSRPEIELDLSALPGFRYFAELGFRDKSVAIWHLDLRQGLLVELPVCGKYPVQAQDISGDRIGVVDAERTRGLIRHGPVNVI